MKIIILIIRHVAAFCQSVVMALRYSQILSIPLSEVVRYFRKSINLSLAYVGFCSDDSIRQARLVGKAAFLCCAYDVCTDWHKDPAAWRYIFLEILRKSQVSKDLIEIAIGLYDLDLANAIPENGLDRGAVSVEFITKMTGSYKALSKQLDLRKFGIACQVADDLLDIDKDYAENTTNFVGKPGWNQRIFLARQILSSREADQLYKRGPILRLALKKGLAKANAKSTLDIATRIETLAPDIASSTNS